MNFYFVLFVVLGTTLPREVSSQGNCIAPGDWEFDVNLSECQGNTFIDKNSSTCHNYSNDSDFYPSFLSVKGPGNYIFFMFLDCLPVLILVPLILFFNINLASGTGHSIVFSAQVLLAIFSIQSVVLNPGGRLWAMMVTGFLVFFNTPLMMFWYPLTLTHIALGYVKVVLAVVIVMVYLGVATASQCPVQCCRGCWARLRRRMRHWREAHLAQRPLFTGACSVAILIYGSLLDVSFRLILGGYRVDSICIGQGWYDDQMVYTCHCHYYTVTRPPICLGSSEHRPYLIPVLVIVTLALLPVLLFFYHPGVPALVSFITKGRLQLPRLHKIKPVLDVFQGVYKPKLQFFAGLHLLHRVLLWTTIAYSNHTLPTFYWLIILAIHGVFMPFESYRHNYLESLIMIGVAMTAFQSIQILTQEEYTSTTPEPLFVIEGIISTLTLYVFPNLPLICVIVYYIYKLVRFCRFCCCRRRQNYQEIPEEQEDIEESFQGERWQPPDQALLN